MIVIILESHVSSTDKVYTQILSVIFYLRICKSGNMLNIVSKTPYSVSGTNF